MQKNKTGLKQMNNQNKTETELQTQRTNKWFTEGREWKEERNRW